MFTSKPLVAMLIAMQMAHSQATRINGVPSVHKSGMSNAHHYDDTGSSTDCYVSVEGDATYCVAGGICGSYDGTNYGTACPNAGDKAVADCVSHIASWNETTRTCVLPFDTTCQLIPTGAYGCVRLQVNETGSLGDTNSSLSTSGSSSLNSIQSSIASEHSMKLQYQAEDPIDVSVLGDATYSVPGPICGGTYGNCPLAGDIASSDCNSALPSYVNGTGCVAPNDALCVNYTVVVNDVSSQIFACSFTTLEYGLLTLVDSASSSNSSLASQEASSSDSGSSSTVNETGEVSGSTSASTSSVVSDPIPNSEESSESTSGSVELLTASAQQSAPISAIASASSASNVVAVSIAAAALVVAIAAAVYVVKKGKDAKKCVDQPNTTNNELQGKRKTDTEENSLVEGVC